MTWTYESISKTLSEMAQVNYEEMIKAFFSMELDISDKAILHQIYQDYMENDDVSLISDELLVISHHYLSLVQEELTDLLEKLYRQGEGDSFIMEAITSNSISETMENYEMLDSNDYSSLTLETLQDIIQKDLALTSHDYFEDVTLIALQKDLLDQKSNFLQHYVASLLDTMPSQKDQSALVLD